MENQKRICVAICFGSSNHFTGLFKENLKLRSTLRVKEAL